jgi:hypothetical protein
VQFRNALKRSALPAAAAGPLTPAHPRESAAGPDACVSQFVDDARLMTTTISPLQATRREPRLALNVTFERSIPGLPSVVEVTSVIGKLTRIFEVASSLPGSLDTADAHVSGVTSLVVIGYGRERCSSLRVSYIALRKRARQRSCQPRPLRQIEILVVGRSLCWHASSVWGSSGAVFRRVDGASRRG